MIHFLKKLFTFMLTRENRLVYAETPTPQAEPAAGESMEFSDAEAASIFEPEKPGELRAGEQAAAAIDLGRKQTASAARLERKPGETSVKPPKMAGNKEAARRDAGTEAFQMGLAKHLPAQAVEQVMTLWNQIPSGDADGRSSFRQYVEGFTKDYLRSKDRLSGSGQEMQYLQGRIAQLSKDFGKAQQEYARRHGVENEGGERTILATRDLPGAKVEGKVNIDESNEFVNASESIKLFAQYPNLTGDLKSALNRVLNSYKNLMMPPAQYKQLVENMGLVLAEAFSGGTKLDRGQVAALKSKIRRTTAETMVAENQPSGKTREQLRAAVADKGLLKALKNPTGALADALRPDQKKGSQKGGTELASGDL